jgi:predicted Zn-dependent protease
MRLSPFDPMLFLMQQGTATAYFLTGRYDEAGPWAAKSIAEYPMSPQTWRIAAASHALAGRDEPAQKAMARLLQIDPALRVSNLKDRAITSRPSELAILAEGLRKAGVPE